MGTQDKEEQTSDFSQMPSSAAHEAEIEACYALLSSGHSLTEVLEKMKQIPRTRADNVSLAARLADICRDLDPPFKSDAAPVEIDYSPAIPELPVVPEPIQPTEPLVERIATLIPAAVEPDTIEEPEVVFDRRRHRVRYRLVAFATICIVTFASVAPVGNLPFTEAAPAPPVPAMLATPIAPPVPPVEPPPETVWIDPPKETIPTLSQSAIEALLARGDALLASADVVAARMFYERAVAAGEAQAAFRLGATYDPDFLARARLRVQGNAMVAKYWYSYGDSKK